MNDSAPTDAISHYHDLLTDSLAAATQEQLDDQQRRRGLFFGNRPLCTVLRPRFLTPSQHMLLQTQVNKLLKAFARVQRLASHQPSFRKQFGLLDWEEQLLEWETGLACDYPTSRLDAFYVSDTELKFTEFNAETPAAAAYGDVLADVFLGLAAMSDFQRKYIVRPVPTRPGVFHALMESYWHWTGRRFAKPKIVILDWKEVPTYSEFVLFRDYFREHGLKCVIADPREVEFREGKLWAEGLAVDLIYKRVLLSELVERGGMETPALQAVKAGAACMVNSPRAKILYKKASFAVISDERNASIFEPDELEAVAAHIPWTRFVEERKTEYQGKEIDLTNWMLTNRDRLVLKPNDDYGGKGIVLGWKVNETEWRQAIATALKTPYVVQERVRLPKESFPSIVDGNVVFADRVVDTNPYGLHGAYMEGCLTRISTEDLVNVTAGGGSTVPTMVVAARP
jgi:uncharacterized circularly permuted ATP-grasp superfamily protein